MFEATIFSFAFQSMSTFLVKLFVLFGLFSLGVSAAPFTDRKCRPTFIFTHSSSAIVSECQFTCSHSAILLLAQVAP